MRTNYLNILIAVDGSKQSEKAFDEAIAIAKRNNSTLHILYVDEVSGNFFGDFAFSTKEIYEELDNLANAQIEKFKERAESLGFVDSKTYIKHGSAKSVIVNFAKDEAPVDLIIVGSTGLNAVERVLVGSTTSYVVNHAPCNVMVIK